MPSADPSRRTLLEKPSVPAPAKSVRLRPIGKGADDLRFFIEADGEHAGGITVHSAVGISFSYGIAIAPAHRRRGIARAALADLFARMQARGATRAIVQIRSDNVPSLALHRALRFLPLPSPEGECRMALTLPPARASHSDTVLP